MGKTGRSLRGKSAAGFQAETWQRKIFSFFILRIQKHSVSLQWIYLRQKSGVNSVRYWSIYHYTYNRNAQI